MSQSKFKPVDEQLAFLKKGAAEIIPEPELKAKLEKSLRTGTPLRVYLGVDPTAPDIHLGHTVVLRKLKHFQDLGHTAIFLIGDFSAMIGDPTGRSETRPPLSREEVDANAKTYLDQVFKLLDKDKTKVHYNSEWLSKMNAEDVVRLCGRYRLARMLEREDFRSRLQNNQPISVHELLYPLLTACDAVTLNSDIEIGATEQKFNLLVHREIQLAVHREQAVEQQLENSKIDVEYERKGQVCLTMPILVGLDGQRKMSKSFGNYVGITESPDEMFGKLMSVSDDTMWKYIELLTEKDVTALQDNVRRGTEHPRDVKVDMATDIVCDFHGSIAATEAAHRFRRIFQDRQTPDEAPVRKLARSGPTRVSTLVFISDLAPSRSEAERLIKQRAVEIGGTIVDDPRKEIDLGKPVDFLLRVGKKKFVRIVVE